MKRLMTLGVVALGLVALGLVAVACGGGGGSQDTQADKAAPASADDHGHDHDDHDGHDHPPTTAQEHPSAAGEAAGTPAGRATAEGAQAAMLPTGSEVTLNGNMGCGHCNFQIGTTCSAAMKTADGHIVIFDNVPATTEMFQKRMEGAAVTVQGVVNYDPAGIAHMTLKETPM